MKASPWASFNHFEEIYGRPGARTPATDMPPQAAHRSTTPAMPRAGSTTTPGVTRTHYARTPSTCDVAGDGRRPGEAALAGTSEVPELPEAEVDTGSEAEVSAPLMASRATLRSSSSTSSTSSDSSSSSSSSTSSSSSSGVPAELTHAIDAMFGVALSNAAEEKEEEGSGAAEGQSLMEGAVMTSAAPVPSTVVVALGGVEHVV